MGTRARIAQVKRDQTEQVTWHYNALSLLIAPFLFHKKLSIS